MSVMKVVVLILVMMLSAQSSFALECASVFSSENLNPTNPNRQLLNAVKRIRNYGTFESLVLINEKSKRMTLVVFDIFNDGVIGERKSIDDHVQELREFASEIRYVQDSFTKDLILTNRLAKLPGANRNENLLQAKFNQPFDILENLRRSETPQESLEFEVFQAFDGWTSKAGPQLNVVLIPLSMHNSFMLNMASSKKFKATTLDALIEFIDPIDSK